MFELRAVAVIVALMWWQAFLGNQIRHETFGALFSALSFYIAYFSYERAISRQPSSPAPVAQLPAGADPAGTAGQR